MNNKNILVCALILGASTSMATWVDNSNTINYDTTLGNTASWNIVANADADPGWLTQSYAYNNDQGVGVDWYYSTNGYILQPQVNNAQGGVVYHFTNTGGSNPCTVDLSAGFVTRQWAGQKIVLYYSDKAWDQISSMSGSVWEGRGVTFDPLWTTVDSSATWSASMYGTLTGALTSTDGDFYVRVDMSLADAPGGAISLGEVHVDLQAQTVPEPASLALLALGGLALVRRRRWA